MYMKYFNLKLYFRVVYYMYVVAKLGISIVSDIV